MSNEVRALRERLDAAVQKGRLPEAVSLCTELQRLEPREPRWPHRRGDVLRRAGRREEAVAAYERAADLYASQGFVARAVAMARVVMDLDPARVDLLKRIDPEAARAVLKQHRSGLPAAIPEAPVVEVDPTGARAESEPPASAARRSAVTLMPAADATSDELRFEDARSIELDLSELEVGPREESLPNFLLDDWERQKSVHDLAELPLVPLFAQLPRSALVDLGAESEVLERGDGQLVLRAGDPADALFAIVEGTVVIDVPDRLDDVILGEGELFGESCLLEGFVRHADVRARGRALVLRIPRRVLDALVERYPGVRDMLFELLTRRIVASLLQTSALFWALDPVARKQVANLFEVRRAPQGTPLAIAGKRSDGLYVVLAGRIELTHPSGEIAMQGPGAVVGQRALLAAQQPADVSVLADTDCLVLRLPAHAFGRIASEHPDALRRLASLEARPDDVVVPDQLT